ncbi:MAG: hypothetical protein HFE90_06125 [Firmicutes bacterium]|nr:hypothetical protein [Bacillota bacterium]
MRNKLLSLKKININTKITGEKSTLPAVAASIGCLLMIISPSLSLSAAKKGIELWAGTVIPSLLPFFICTDILIKTGVHVIIGRLFEKPVRFLMGVPGEAAFVFVSSILSGYPTGARIISELKSEGNLSQKEAEHILSFCSTSGPLFIVAAVGAGMLNSPELGYIILISHYAAAIFTGIYFIPDSVLNRISLDRIGKGSRRTKNKTSQEYGAKHSQTPNENLRKISGAYSGKKGFAEILSEAILSSFNSIMIIGGYIIIFSMLTEYLAHFTSVISEIFLQNGEFYAGKTDSAEFLSTIMGGLLEMTVGCKNVSQSGILPIKTTAVFCSFLISFGGLSVAGQTMSVLKGTEIRFGSFISFKLMHGLISACITVIILMLISS